MALGAAALLLAGLAFWPQYLSRSPADVDGYTHLHAAFGTAWLGVVIAQAGLMARGKLAWHRRVGRSTWLLAPGFVLSGLLLAHFRFSRMTSDRFAAEAPTLYLPISASLLFAFAWGLGVALRHRRPLHARLMAATVVPLIDPVVGRILFFYFPPLPTPVLYQAFTYSLAVLLLIAMTTTLPPASADRRAFRRFAVASVVVMALWFGLPLTSWWTAFGEWFRGLPLT